MANITTSFKTIAQAGKNAGLFKIKIRFVSKTKEFKLDKDVTIPFILFRQKEWTGNTLIATHDSYKSFEIIKNDIQIYLNGLQNSRLFNIDAIKNILKQHDINSSDKIIYLTNSYIDSLEKILVTEQNKVNVKVNGITKNTYKCYKDVVAVYKKFILKYNKYKNYKNIQLTQEWFLQFQNWIFNYYGYNSANTFRKFLMCLTRKILGNTQFEICKFKFENIVEKPEDNCKEILTQDEIIKIFKTNFDEIQINWTGYEKYKNRLNLNDVKIVAVLGWHTGMRYSDLTIMNYENVDFNKNLVRYNVKKTSQIDLKVPIFGILKHYLNGYNKIPNMSLEYFNAGIKIIARALGMNEKTYNDLDQFVELDDEMVRRNVSGEYERWQLFSAHMLRRSFATYMFKQRDTEGVGQTAFVYSIMKLTGHKDLETFLKYIVITSDERAEYLGQALNYNSNNFDFDFDSIEKAS